MLILILMGLASASGVAADESSYVELLKKHRVPVQTEGLLAYLRTWQPRDEEDAGIATSISQLGAETFAARDAAQRALERVGWAIVPQLEAALKHTDLEVRERVRAILAVVTNPSNPQQRIFVAALRVIAHRKPRGVAPLLARLAVICREYEAHEAHEAALFACVSFEDRPALLALLKARHGRVRAAALAAFGRLYKPPTGKKPGGDELKLFRTMLGDASEHVRFHAVLALSPFEPRACLPTLVALLAAEDGRIRRIAASMLRSLTGQHFGYTAVARAEARQAAIDRWRDWVNRFGKDAKLRLPDAVSKRLGRMILCQPYKHLLEWDDAGREVFKSTTLRTVTGAQGLPNGHRVVCEWSQKVLVELDRSGKEVWRKALPGTPNGLHRLPSGNTLVALFNEQQVIEMNPKGEVVWKIATGGSPTAVQRLENGLTMVAIHSTGEIVEFDRDGKRKSKLAAPSPESARRLANGHTLIASASGKVIQFDQNKKQVWSANVTSPFDAVRLENGHTLVATQRGLTTVDGDGKVVSEKTIGYVRRIARY